MPNSQGQDEIAMNASWKLNQKFCQVFQAIIEWRRWNHMLLLPPSRALWWNCMGRFWPSRVICCPCLSPWRARTAVSMYACWNCSNKGSRGIHLLGGLHIADPQNLALKHSSWNYCSICSVYISPYDLIQEHPLAELLVLCVRQVTDIFKKKIIPCIPQGCRYQQKLLLLEKSLIDSQHYLKVALLMSKPIFWSNLIHHKYLLGKSLAQKWSWDPQPDDLPQRHSRRGCSPRCLARRWRTRTFWLPACAKRRCTGDSGGRVPRLGWLRFGMFHHPAWAVGSYGSGPPAEGTPQI